MTISVAAFVTAITQQEEVLVIPLPAYLTVLKKTSASIKNKRTLLEWSLFLVNGVEMCSAVVLLFYLLLTTFMMDLSQAIDFCSCWMHMANWAALRTSLRAFLHTFIPWATSSSPLGEDNEE